MGVDEEKPPVQAPISTLTPAQEKEMRSMGAINDGTISAEEAVAKMRSSLSRYKKGMVVILALLVMSWLGNTGLMATVFQLSKDLKVENGALKNMNGDAVSTHYQKNVYQVTLVTHADHVGESPVVAQASCSNVLLAIASMKNGDDESLVEIAVGNDGDVWEPRMSAASFHVRNQSFGIGKIYLDDSRTTSYDVNCEMSKAACEGAPDTLCDATGVRDDISFDDSFDGDQKDSRRRLNPTKEAAQLVLSEAYKDSANDNSANHTIDDLCALVNHSAHEGVAKLCEDLSGVGLDESVYCGHDVVTEEKAGQVLEPSFTMREVLGSDDLEQTYTAVADRCEGTTGRRQMAWYPGKNYGWCSMAAGFLVGQKSDTADYCDASQSEPPDGKGSATSNCCVVHDKCLSCEKTTLGRVCRGGVLVSSPFEFWGSSCDIALAQCVRRVSCATVLWTFWTSWPECSFWKGCRWKSKKHTIWGYNFECVAANTLIYNAMKDGVLHMATYCS